jgi:hypothetical protein
MLLSFHQAAVAAMDAKASLGVPQPSKKEKRRKGSEVAARSTGSKEKEVHMYRHIRTH